VTRGLMTYPRVGPLTASAYHLYLAAPTSQDVAYLPLFPRSLTLSSWCKNIGSIFIPIGVWSSMCLRAHMPILKIH
jgi:hypothetical protein